MGIVDGILNLIKSLEIGKEYKTLLIQMSLMYPTHIAIYKVKEIFVKLSGFDKSVNTSKLLENIVIDFYVELLSQYIIESESDHFEISKIAKIRDELRNREFSLNSKTFDILIKNPSKINVKGILVGLRVEDCSKSLISFTHEYIISNWLNYMITRINDNKDVQKLYEIESHRERIEVLEEIKEDQQSIIYNQFNLNDSINKLTSFLKDHRNQKLMEFQKAEELYNMRIYKKAYELFDKIDLESDKTDTYENIHILSRKVQCQVNVNKVDFTLLRYNLRKLYDEAIKLQLYSYRDSEIYESVAKVLRDAFFYCPEKEIMELVIKSYKDINELYLPDSAEHQRVQWNYLEAKCIMNSISTIDKIDDLIEEYKLLIKYYQIKSGDDDIIITGNRARVEEYIAKSTKRYSYFVKAYDSYEKHISLIDEDKYSSYYHQELVKFFEFLSMSINEIGINNYWNRFHEIKEALEFMIPDEDVECDLLYSFVLCEFYYALYKQNRNKEVLERCYKSTIDAMNKHKKVGIRTTHFYLQIRKGYIELYRKINNGSDYSVEKFINILGLIKKDKSSIVVAKMEGVKQLIILGDELANFDYYRDAIKLYESIELEKIVCTVDLNNKIMKIKALLISSISQAGLNNQLLEQYYRLGVKEIGDLIELSKREYIILPNIIQWMINVREFDLYEEVERIMNDHIINGDINPYEEMKLKYYISIALMFYGEYINDINRIKKGTSIIKSVIDTKLDYPEYDRHRYMQQYALGLMKCSLLSETEANALLFEAIYYIDKVIDKVKEGNRLVYFNSFVIRQYCQYFTAQVNNSLNLLDQIELDIKQFYQEYNLPEIVMEPLQQIIKGIPLVKK